MTSLELLLAFCVVAALSATFGYHLAQAASFKQRNRLTQELLQVEALLDEIQSTIESLDEKK